MKLSTKMIMDDVEKLVISLKEEEVLIPPFWQACRPALLAFVSIITLQGGVIIFSTNVNELDSLVSMAFSAFLGFIVFIGCMSASGSYLSLPERIRNESFIYRVIKIKVRWYILLWAVMAIASAVITIFFELSPIVTPGALVVCMVMLYMIFSADMSRYNLSALSAAITAWRTNSQSS